MGCTPPPGTQCPNAHVYRDRGWFQGQKCLLQAGLAGMSVLCPCPVLPLKTEQDRQPSSHSWNSLNAGGRSPDCLRGGCGPAHPGGRGRGPVEAIALHTHLWPCGAGVFPAVLHLDPPLQAAEKEALGSKGGQVHSGHGQVGRRLQTWPAPQTPACGHGPHPPHKSCSPTLAVYLGGRQKIS